MTESLPRLVQSLWLAYRLRRDPPRLLRILGPGIACAARSLLFVASGEMAPTGPRLSSAGSQARSSATEQVTVWELTVVKLSCSACPGDPSLLRPWALPGHSHFAGENRRLLQPVARRAHLGPPINLVAGLLGMPWLAFSLVGALGEVVWVFGFVMLGYAFSQSILAISARLGDLAWFLAEGAIAIFLALRVQVAAFRVAHPR